MSLMLERNVYRGCNYVIKKQFNYYNILCTNNNCYLNYEKVRKDILEETTSIKNLGKRLLFLLCNIESFDSLLKKDRKELQFKFEWSHSLLYKYSKMKEDDVLNSNVNVNYTEGFNFSPDVVVKEWSDDPSPNTNDIITIINYDEFMSNEKVQNSIIDYCKVNGLPYYNHYWDDEVDNPNYKYEEDYMEIKVKDLVLYSITLYLLIQINEIMIKNNLNNIHKLNTLLGLRKEKYDKKIYTNFFKDFIDMVAMYIKESSMTYRNKSPIQLICGDIVNDNVIQGVLFNFINNINNDNLSICKRCSTLFIKMRDTDTLCNNCYYDNPNFNRNKKDREQREEAKKIYEKLIKLNNEELNKKLSEIKAVKDKFKHASKKDIQQLNDLYKEYHIK